MSEIRTARLLLRRARIGDLSDMHAILSDRQATRYWSTLPHATIEESRQWLAAMISAPDDLSDDYVVELDGRVIGKAGCWRLPDIGFILHPEYWGRGLAREALAAIIASIFARRPIPELTADVDPRNAACLKLLTGLGFRETGRASATYRIGDEVSDSVYLALPRPPASR